MNPETAREDVMKLDGGAAVVYDELLKLDALRSDLHFYPVPFDKLVGPVCPEAKLRKLVRNMIYDGIVANLLSIDMEEVHKALLKQFGKKKAKAAELNWGACQAGYDYAAKTFTKSDPFRVQRMNSTAGKIIIEGNAIDIILEEGSQRRIADDRTRGRCDLVVSQPPPILVVTDIPRSHDVDVQKVVSKPDPRPASFRSALAFSGS